jgi:hypothetical protein
MGDRVLAWDLPAPPGYRLLKRDLFLLIEPRWAPFFDDEDAKIDWRLVGWGGVYIDDRPDATRGQICPRGCIPALDQPAVTDAEGGTWYSDNDLVFGIVIGGQARAYPKNIMEVHEMVNDTLGGRRVAIPYCTLCLSAQAYFTDDVEGFRPLMRTSGLLSRSNKFMYDVDPRLGVHDVVLGVMGADGTPVAFPVAPVRLVLDAGEEVALAGVTLRPDAGGLRAFIDGAETPAHEAFWFAWSQFRPNTLLWER